MDGRLTFCVVFTSIILLVKSWPTEIRVAAKQESGQLDVVFFCYSIGMDQNCGNHKRLQDCPFFPVDL